MLVLLGTNEDERKVFWMTLKNEHLQRKGDVPKTHFKPACLN